MPMTLSKNVKFINEPKKMIEIEDKGKKVEIKANVEFVGQSGSSGIQHSLTFVTHGFNAKGNKIKNGTTFNLK